MDGALFIHHTYAVNHARWRHYPGASAAQWLSGLASSAVQRRVRNSWIWHREAALYTIAAIMTMASIMARTPVMTMTMLMTLKLTKLTTLWMLLGTLTSKMSPMTIGRRKDVLRDRFIPTCPLNFRLSTDYKRTSHWVFCTSEKVLISTTSALRRDPPYIYCTPVRTFPWCKQTQQQCSWCSHRLNSRQTFRTTTPEMIRYPLLP